MDYLRPNRPRHCVTQRHLAARLCMPLLLVLCCCGCRFTVGMIRAVAGDALVPSIFESKTGVNLTKGDQRLLILCSTTHSVADDDVSLATDIVDGMSRRLRHRGVDVVDSDSVSGWLEEHGTWDDLSAIAAEFDADYVTVINIRHITYQEPSSTNLLRAHVLGEISVYGLLDKDTPNARVTDIYSMSIDDQYPSNYPISGEGLSEGMFREQTVDYLCQKFARHFHSYHEKETIQ